MCCMNGTLNVAKQVFILMEHCCRRRLLDESGLFFKALPDTGLAKKNPKSVKAVRNQKSDLLRHFLCPRVDSR